VLGTVGKSVLTKAFDNTVKAIEAQSSTAGFAAKRDVGSVG